MIEWGLSFFLLSAVAVINAVYFPELILNGGPSKDKIFRGNTLYMKSSTSADIKCQMPSSYNESLFGKATPAWETGGSSFKPTTSGEFACVPLDDHKKQIPNWQNATLRVFVVPNDVNIVAQNAGPLNYSASNEPMTFICNAKNSSVTWSLDGKPLTEASNKNIRVHVNNTLVVSHPSYLSVGIYLCKDASTNQPLAFYSVEGAPFFVLKHGKNNDSKNEMEGDSVSIEHEIYGNPLTDIKWSVEQSGDTKNAVVLTSDELSKQARIKVFQTQNVTNGRLEITNLEKGDRAYYVATMKNQYGEHTFKTLLRVKGKLDALWPFLGILAEVIVLVAIILIYERRRLKRDQEVEESGEQKKPLTANNSESLRQRKN